MNLCLGSVSPTLFLLLEARFGSSMLQNYDGILRNKPLSSRLGLVWRLVLGLYLALPLGLSASYKSFAGGESAMMVNAATYTGNTSYYGMFGPPGLQLLGQNTGVSLFSNATLPFAMGTSSQKGPEPPVPKHAQAYGFNVLMLNDESTAILDIPQPSYVSAVQGLLGGRESWNITAPVFATVATFNHSKTKNEDAFESNFEDFCEAAEDSSGAYTHKSMLNEWAVGLVNHASPGDQSLQYVGLSPDPGIEHRPSCSEFSHYAQPYDVNRQFCKGTWSITRGGIQLANGSCNGTNLAPTQQQIITNNSLFPGVWYMSSLVEFLGPFAVERNESKWVRSYMATGIAAMLWSRIIAIDCSSILQGSHDDPYMFHNLTYKDAGLIYPVKDIAVHIRPTLRKSSWLYFLLATQPLLIIGMLGMTLMLHSTPLDNGFGLISILSGIDRRGLDVLAGAALSGELVRTVKLTMNPLHDDEKGTIQYDVVLPSTVSPHNGRLAPKIVYH
ncbi:MAG: hypothetical protein M1831_000728 [Alyxoria varia]|nr:MAG: hypothetical protein M1831_000728 [Alyxoria varia]